MRIVNKEQFLALPEGTVYAKYTPHYFGDICIKGDTLGNDFLEQSLTQLDAADTGEFFYVLENAMRTGESFKLDLDCYGRDGLFEPDRLFVVWEPADVRQLIDRLELCLSQLQPV